MHCRPFPWLQPYSKYPPFRRLQLHFAISNPISKCTLKVPGLTSVHTCLWMSTSGSGIKSEIIFEAMLYDQWLVQTALLMDILLTLFHAWIAKDWINHPKLNILPSFNTTYLFLSRSIFLHRKSFPMQNKFSLGTYLWSVNINHSGIKYWRLGRKY